MTDHELTTPIGTYTYTQTDCTFKAETSAVRWLYPSARSPGLKPRRKAGRIHRA